MKYKTNIIHAWIGRKGKKLNKYLKKRKEKKEFIFIHPTPAPSIIDSHASLQLARPPYRLCPV